MKSIPLIAVLMFLSFNSNASDALISKLDCTIKSQGALHEWEKAFNIEINFDSPIAAMNNSSFSKVLKADLAITLLKDNMLQKVVVRQVSFGQETSLYEYEIHFQKKILNSGFNSWIIMHPNFKKSFSGTKLINYVGEFQINALIDGNDVMLSNNSSILECVAK